MSQKHTKAELVALALSKGLVKNKTEAVRKNMSDLMALLSLGSEDQGCGSLTKEEIVKKFSARFDLLNLSKSEVESITKEDLCALLFPKQIPEFDPQHCKDYSKAQLLHYSASMAVPLGQVADATALDWDRACELLSKANARTYNSVQDPKWTKSESESCMQPADPTIKLQPHQIRVAKHILTHRGLLAVHDVGTGKTFASLAAIQCVTRRFPNIRVVVLTPRSLIDNFVSNAERYGIPKGRIEVYGFDAYVAFYKRAQAAGAFPDFSNTFLVIDEAHNLRNKPIIRKLTDGDEDQEEIQAGIRAAIIMQAAAQAFKVLLLTATPFVNKFDDITNLLMMVKGDSPEGPRLSESKIKEIIVDRWNSDFKNMWSCRVSYHMPNRDPAHYPELLPENIVQFIMTDPYYNVYRSVETRAFNDHIASKIGSSGTGTAFYNKLRRAVNLDLDDKNSNPKVDWIIDFLKKEIGVGKKTVIYSNWKHAGINQIRSKLDENSIPYVYITGDVATDDRKAAVDKYNDRDSGVKVMLISKAGAEGLNLMETRNVIILESNWNPATEKQIIGRAVRYDSHVALPPSERTVSVWRLIMDKPTDHKDNRNSIDRELYNMSYRDKKSQEEVTMRRLQQSSIELDVCSCNKNAPTTFCPAPTAALHVRPVEKASAPKQTKTTYAAPPPKIVVAEEPRVKLSDEDLEELFDL